MLANPSASRLSDESLAGFDTLMGTLPPEPIVAAYASAGSIIDQCSRIQVTWSPGTRLIVRFRIHGIGGDLAGRRDVVASVGTIPDGALLVEGSDASVGIWVVPHDPVLPGLASAMDASTVGGVLDRLGHPDTDVRTRLVAYRPARRAVVEVRSSRRTLYVKVVPPGSVARLHQLHRYLSSQAPVPDSIGFDPDLGLLILPPVPGESLRTVLRNPDLSLPDPSAIVGLAHGLPAPETDTVCTSPIDRLGHATSLLRRLVPDESGRIDAIVSRIGPETEDPTTPSHGDFYEAQVLVRDAAVTGFVDVDTFGWGRRSDDAATMLGHLAMLSEDSSHADRILSFTHRLASIWSDTIDTEDTLRRAAAVVLGLATGPFRVQSPDWERQTRSRITSATRMLNEGLPGRERSLIANSRMPHVGIRI
ncbi:MAG TPA: phosphotransferase [Acidimicrobiia bacterium]|nr:phosphotransferase [Acidimicrobiia bacterium]